MSEPSDVNIVDANGRLNRDVACANCAYNLRGCSATGTCPECGTEIKQSLKTGSPAIPVDIARRFRSGLLYVGIGLVLMPATPCVGVAAGMFFERFSAHRSFLWGWVTAAAFSSGPALMTFGAQALSAPLPDGRSLWSDDGRSMFRVFAWLSLVFYMAGWIIALSFDVLADGFIADVAMVAVFWCCIWLVLLTVLSGLRYAGRVVNWMKVTGVSDLWEATWSANCVFAGLLAFILILLPLSELFTKGSAMHAIAAASLLITGLLSAVTAFVAVFSFLGFVYRMRIALKPAIVAV